jgi:hypothetical protein
MARELLTEASETAQLDSLISANLPRYAVQSKSIIIKTINKTIIKII